MNSGDSQRVGVFFLVILCLTVYGFSLFTAGRTRSLKPIPFSRQEKGKVAVQIQGGEEEGVYFVFPDGTGLPLLFKSAVRNHRLKISPGSSWSLSPEGKLQKGTMSAAVRLALDIPLDVNQADFDDLVLVPGIGEKTAAAIVSLRTDRGRFSNLDELQEVPGIKEKRLKKIRPFLAVGEER